MTKTLDQAIEELVTDITTAESSLREKKQTVNVLCGVAGREPLYSLADRETAVPSRIRADQFYGQPLASAVRTILEMRKQQDLGAATNNEIYDALIAGGYKFNTKSDDVARNSLRNSLSKNTVAFHKLPNGRFGLAGWYPNAKTTKPTTAFFAGGSSEEIIGETENEEATTEGSAAAS